MNASDPSIVQRIRRLAKKLVDCPDEDLQRQGLSLKYRAMTGAKINDLIPQAFALVCESTRRSIGMVPYNVQLFGGIQIARGYIAEMKTGEGKTLTATLPVFLHALYDRGAHVVTVNDYLAKRDYETMGPVYRQLGLTVGVIQADDTPEQRKIAYRQDITYGTAKEFGFDFLRDRLKQAGSSSLFSNQTDTLMRGLNFVLVDEADSVLIDEARTPLIIGIVDQAEEERKRDCFRWAADHANRFVEGDHYKYEHDRRNVTLETGGIELLRQLPQNESTRRIPIRQLYDYMENAIKVRRDFQLDQHYVIRDGEVAIVDEFTGRVAEGRKWQSGIHQSVEAKENLEITPATGQGATITMQTFFRRYRFFGGMSGTAWSSRAEFKKVYRKKVVRVPTNRPVKRTQLPTRVFADFDSKIKAVVEEAKTISERGRAILIGTRSVEKSERLSRALASQNIEHQVLNANNNAQEAEIVADCGRSGRVTVATNMAGRGTDIILEDSVRQAGGLHVILTEIHESKRIDWQLIGRGSRQGDPGSFRIMVSLDDELLLRGAGPKKSQRLIDKFPAARSQGRALPRDIFKFFRSAQNRMERKNLVDRMILLKQDKERQERHFEMGLDPFCDVVQS